MSFLKENFSKYFKGYNQSEIESIIRNWNQYFKEDVFSLINKSISNFPISFDSYGGIYPDYSLLKNFNKLNFSAGIRKDVNLLKYSMFQIFTWSDNQKVLKESIQNLSKDSDKEFYIELLNDFKVENYISLSEAISAFYQKWNQYHFDKNNQLLIEKIKTTQPKKILFFIHGYNVPHSLAAVQAIEITKHILECQKAENDLSKFLLIPIYWTSNNQKKCDFDDLEKINIKNKIRIGNAHRFLYYSNRAYFAAIGLRQIICQLESSKIDLPELYLFSHSLGTTIATSAVINTTSKLQTKLPNFIYNDRCTSVKIEANVEKRFKKKENVNWRLINKFDSIPLPNSKIRIFLSAPAIPGLNTFRDLCQEKINHFAFYSTINTKDKILRKFIGVKRKLGATTLGLNTDDEALETKQKYFSNGGHFEFNEEFMSHKNHNIFSYLEKKEYQNLIHKYWYHAFID